MAAREAEKVALPQVLCVWLADVLDVPKAPVAEAKPVGEPVCVSPYSEGVGQLEEEPAVVALACVALPEELNTPLGEAEAQTVGSELALNAPGDFEVEAVGASTVALAAAPEGVTVAQSEGVPLGDLLLDDDSRGDAVAEAQALADNERCGERDAEPDGCGLPLRLAQALEEREASEDLLGEGVALDVELVEALRDPAREADAEPLGSGQLDAEAVLDPPAPPPGAVCDTTPVALRTVDAVAKAEALRSALRDAEPEELPAPLPLLVTESVEEREALLDSEPLREPLALDSGEPVLCKEVEASAEEEARPPVEEGLLLEEAQNDGVALCLGELEVERVRSAEPVPLAQLEAQAVGTPVPLDAVL